MHYSYTLGFLLLCSLLTAQTTPWFSITLHVEDAVGNRDSVVVGVDPEASTVELDPAFGEVLLDSPFDSVLEARAARKFSADRLLAKRIITKGSPFANDPDNCFSGIILIYIHAKHQPVRVYWDRSKYVTDDCHSGAFLLNHYEFEVSFPPPDPEDLSPLYFCMAAADSAEVMLTGDQPDSIGEPLVELRWEVEGQGEQSIYGLYYVHMPIWFYTPCVQVVSTDEIDRPRAAPLRLYPNPTAGSLYPNVPEGTRLKRLVVYDLSGRELEAHRWQGQLLDISGYPPGLYWVVATAADGRQWVGRVMKK